VLVQALNPERSDLFDKTKGPRNLRVGPRVGNVLLDQCRLEAAKEGKE
jgi:hypothetical protein